MAGLEARAAGWALLVATVLASPAAAQEAMVLKCSAFGGSHTVRMTFDFYPERCRLYWREVGRFLEPTECRAGRLTARKPFAPINDAHVTIDLDTLAFTDRYGGVEDRGACVQEERAR